MDLSIICPAHDVRAGPRKGNVSGSSTRTGQLGKLCYIEPWSENEDWHGSGLEISSMPYCVDGTPRTQSVHQILESPKLQDPRPHDFEKGTTCSEHVILKFEGSNCAGCTKKISKVLNSMPGLHNLQMDAMLLQAEFDIDLATTSIREVIGSAQRKTGRTCERVMDRW